ncbi:MAG TPA: hypothetical protein VJ853_03920, partial [Thermoanaerobaculia bacterium]|nr:hypothetical protein [Thermoanaerobaculia bacterium]
MALPTTDSRERVPQRRYLWPNSGCHPERSEGPGGEGGAQRLPTAQVPRDARNDIWQIIIDAENRSTVTPKTLD